MIKERTDIERDERARCLLASHRHYQPGSRAARSREDLTDGEQADLAESIVSAISDLLHLASFRGLETGDLVGRSMDRVELEQAMADPVLLRLDAERLIGEDRVPLPVLLRLVHDHRGS